MKYTLIRKILKEHLFIKYGINESFDKPFSNVIKENPFKYIVDENGITGVRSCLSNDILDRRYCASRIK